MDDIKIMNRAKFFHKNGSGLCCLGLDASCGLQFESVKRINSNPFNSSEMTTLL